MEDQSSYVSVWGQDYSKHRAGTSAFFSDTGVCVSCVWMSNPRGSGACDLDQLCLQIKSYS